MTYCNQPSPTRQYSCGLQSEHNSPHWSEYNHGGAFTWTNSWETR